VIPALNDRPHDCDRQSQFCLGRSYILGEDLVIEATDLVHRRGRYGVLKKIAWLVLK
jgi:hypothetical protein